MRDTERVATIHGFYTNVLDSSWYNETLLPEVKKIADSPEEEEKIEFVKMANHVYRLLVPIIDANDDFNERWATRQMGLIVGFGTIVEEACRYLAINHSQMAADDAFGEFMANVLVTLAQDAEES